MKKILLLSFVLICLLSIKTFSQSVIISECCLAGDAASYIELYNTSDETVDLSDYILFVAYNGQGWKTADTHESRSIRLAGQLGPKQTWLTSKEAYNYDENGDSTLNANHWLFAMADTTILFRVGGRGSDLFRLGQGHDAYGLGYYLPYDSVQTFYEGTDSMYVDTIYHKGDSLMIDVFGFPDESVTVDVAGVPAATEYHGFARKANVTKGEPDFNVSRGGTPEESQWLVLPLWEGSGINRKPHNTIKIHGDYTDFGFESASVALDDASGKITMPYGIRKDSLHHFATMGPNTGYTYEIGPDTANSVVFRTGDTLDIFVVGNELISKRYIAEVAAPAEDMKIAFPPLMGRNYEVTEGVPGMDTIYNVGFATRKDTLLDYIEIATNATASFIWVDGTERVDLKDGDVMRVTAADGSHKDYFISVNEYSPDDNTYLNQIYVNGDSLIDFAERNFNYFYELPMGTEKIPSIIGIVQDRRSSSVVTPPLNLKGSLDERTAKITVYAENDTITRDYFITFQVKTEKPDFEGEAFISQYIRATSTAVEIYNPSSEFIDLSEYLLYCESSNSITNWEDIFTRENFIEKLPQLMRFGYYVDTTRHDGIFFLQTDKVDAIVDPGNTFNMAQNISKWRDPTVLERSHFVSGDVARYGFDDLSGFHQTLLTANDPIVLFKIENDSVLSGAKSATDPADFRIVDLIGEFGRDEPWTFGPDSTSWAEGTSARREMIVRLPHVWKGNPNSSWSPEGDFGLEDSTTLEWDYQTYVDLGNQGKYVSFDYGSHFASPVSVHLSTVSSIVYLVSDGYIEEQTIKGVAPQSSVTSFYENLIKAHKDQTLKVMSGSTEKTGADELVTGDKLIVTSSDGSHTTTYVITVKVLSDDATLSSTVYTVTTDQVQQVPVGALLSDVLANVTPAEGAVINVVDDLGQIVPFTMLNADTVLVDVLATEDMILEVTAENNITKKQYAIKFVKASDEVWLLSSFYNVNEELGIVKGLAIPEIVSAVLSRLTIPEGASIKVVDKLGIERTMGHIVWDDMIVVTSASGQVSKSYYLNFKDEGIPDAINKPFVKPEMNLKLYPNPASTYCIVEGGENVRNIVVRNILGAVVYAGNYRQSAGSLRIDISGFDKGMYFVTVVNENRAIETLKLIKK